MPKTAGTKNVSDDHYTWLAQMINANFKKYYGSYNTTTNNENNKVYYFMKVFIVVEGKN